MRAARPRWISALLLGLVGCASPNPRNTLTARHEPGLFAARRPATPSPAVAAAPTRRSDGRLAQYYPGLYASDNERAPRGVAAEPPRALAARGASVDREPGRPLYTSSSRLGTRSVERTASSASVTTLAKAPPRPRANRLLPYSIPVRSGLDSESRSLGGEETAEEVGSRLYPRGEDLGVEDSEAEPASLPLEDEGEEDSRLLRESGPPMSTGEEEPIDDLPRMSRKSPRSLEGPDPLAGRPRLASLDRIPGLPEPIFPATYYRSAEDRDANADLEASRRMSSLWRRIAWSGRSDRLAVQLARRESNDVSER